MTILHGPNHATTAQLGALRVASTAEVRYWQEDVELWTDSIATPVILRGSSIEALGEFLIKILVHLVTLRAGGTSSLSLPDNITAYSEPDNLSSFLLAEYYRTYSV